MNDTLFAKSTYSQTPSKMMVVVLMNTTKSFLSKLDEQFDRVLSETNLTTTDSKIVSFNNENVIKIEKKNNLIFKEFYLKS